MADAEVNGIYADIQNSAIIGSITGEKGGKRSGQIKQKQGSKRLMRTEQRILSAQLEVSIFDHQPGGSRASDTVYVIQSRKGQ